MFAVDEATALAIQQACQDGGELSGVIELRRHLCVGQQSVSALISTTLR